MGCDCPRPLGSRSALAGLVFLAVVAGGGVVACSEAETQPAPEARDRSLQVGSGSDGAAQESALLPVPPRDQVEEDPEAFGIGRYRRWSDRIGQGAQPEGERAFAALRALGFRTLLTVDGAVPDVEGARRYGLAYVHLPMGYDGIPRDVALKIVKAVDLSEGPVYFHCHHGKHRGPAGCMIARIAADGISNEEALKELKESETSPAYKGLWRDVSTYTPPAAEDLETITAADLASTVRPIGLRSSMVQISERFELLKLSQAAGWKTPESHPDVSPAHEARMLWELHRETARMASHRDPSFQGFLAQGEREARALEAAIRAASAAQADRHFTALSNVCDACHAAWRN